MPSSLDIEIHLKPSMVALTNTGLAKVAIRNILDQKPIRTELHNTVEWLIHILAPAKVTFCYMMH